MQFHAQCSDSWCKQITFVIGEDMVIGLEIVVSRLENIYHFLENRLSKRMCCTPPSVVYFHQLLGAAGTRMPVQIYFVGCFHTFCEFEIFLVVVRLIKNIWKTEFLPHLKAGCYKKSISISFRVHTILKKWSKYTTIFWSLNNDFFTLKYIIKLHTNFFIDRVDSGSRQSQTNEHNKQLILWVSPQTLFMYWPPHMLHISTSIWVLSTPNASEICFFTFLQDFDAKMMKNVAKIIVIWVTPKCCLTQICPTLAT